MSYHIRHKKTGSDTVAGTWVHYDVLARIPGRGWVKVGEVGTVTAYGWDATDWEGGTIASGYRALPTRREASYEVAWAFEAAVSAGKVDPSVYVYPEPAARGATGATIAAPAPATVPSAPATVYDQRYVLVADPGIPMFAQVIGQSDQLAPLLDQVQGWGPFEREEVTEFPVAWARGLVVRRFGNPSGWPTASKLILRPEDMRGEAGVIEADKILARWKQGTPSGLYFEIVDLRAEAPATT